MSKEEGIDPSGGEVTKQGILAEVGAISLVALGALIGKLLFSGSNTARDTVVITTPEHNRQGYRRRKKEHDRRDKKLFRSRRG
jgi:hypothetical protein